MNLLRPLILLSLPLLLSTQPDCGGSYRWDVKTAQDTCRIIAKPIRSTISYLTAIPRPTINNSHNRYGIEHNIFTIRVSVRLYKREDDGDYHLVLTDSTGKTMVGEIPDPLCPAVQSSRYILSIQKAREFFVFKMKQPAGKVAPGTYEIKGIAFFDKIHGATGEAKNGVELHPIISIKRIN